ncbi:unnamed protein product [Zymoseptoria tritici ST99CH_1A5]|uniref:C2H2-type domain-containing protein n=2 Tax=Zymoseptoria tritici TaxID=1047171 RepID=A0A1X7S3K9_ZYMT9|nr:unnamed protein product [Zymoseptoria tritici ST99CH_3D7]SMY27926.1 unnamed protein product [Zymoseptoria tritici ST99CH_1A5]
MSYYPDSRSRKPQTTGSMVSNNAMDYSPASNLSTSFSQQYEQTQYNSSTSWADVGASLEDQYAMAQSIAWSTDPSRQVLLDSMQTPTQAMFMDMPLSQGNSNVTSSMTWPATLANSLHSTQYPTSQQGHIFAATQNCYVQPDSLQGLSSDPSYATWPLPQNSADSYFVRNNLSPGRSDYSVSSQSGISLSPYANSEPGRNDTAHVKVEELYEPARSRLNSDGATDVQHHHVNLNDVHRPPRAVAEKQRRSSSRSSLQSEYMEQKPSMSTSRVSPALRRSISSNNVRDNRADKRGFTTKANSTCACQLCGRYFQRTYNLRAHMETHNPVRDQPWKCQHEGCERRFVRKTDLVRHWDSVHLKARPHHCKLCLNSFARKDTLRRHIEDGCRSRPEGQRRSSSRRASNSSANHAQQHRQQYSDTAPFPKVEPEDE